MLAFYISESQPEQEGIMTIKDYFDKQNWIWAVTYAKKSPHYYIVRHKCEGSDEEFMWAVNFIKRHGATMHYWSLTNKYIYLDGWWYWSMNDANDEPIVINRCWAEDYYVSTKWKGSR